MIHVKLSGVLILCIICSTLFSQNYMSFEDKPLPAFSVQDEAVLQFCINQPAYKHLDKTEKEFYYLVNYSRSHPEEFFENVITPIVALYPQLSGDFFTSLKEDFSKADSLPLLKLNEALVQMAENHSKDITSNSDKPSHTSTNGDSFMERFKKSGLKKCGGENISYGSDNPAFLLTLLYLDVGVPSLGHRKALLNPNFTETGIGSSFFKNGSIFLVEDFACPQN
jgi:hypothetical protein